MNKRQDAFLAAAALCERYAMNLSELPHAADAARECAAMLREAAKLAPAITKAGSDCRQEILRIFFP